MADPIFPVIPTDIPAQAAETIGRAPAFVWNENGRGGAFQLVDGALVERTGREAVRQWFELMLRQKPGAIPIYRTDSSSQPGVDRTMLDRRMPEGWVQAEIERQARETAAFARRCGQWTALCLRGCGAAFRSNSPRICTQTRQWR